MSSLTFPARSKPINSAEDFVNSNSHKMMIPAGNVAEDFLRTAEGGIMKDVWQKVLKQDCYSIHPLFHYHEHMFENPNKVFMADAYGSSVRVKYDYTTTKGW